MENGYLPEGSLLRTGENLEYLASEAMLERAMERRVTLESIAVLCDGDMNLHIDLGCMQGLMRREETVFLHEYEELKDIAILTRVGKPIAFKVVGFTRNEYGEKCALLSRREAQRDCMLHHIDALLPGDVIRAKITHMESFGAFVDIGCGVVSLLPIDCISVSRIAHPRERFSVGDMLPVVVREIDETRRVFVSHRELLGTWQENASLFEAGETVIGTVRSIESYGIFVELTPNLAGLAELHEGVKVGDRAAVYIKSIIPEKMKVKLIVIDSYAESAPPAPLEYYLTAENTDHLSYWRYSPPECSRVIGSVFD